jgi:hypothetical protein
MNSFQERRQAKAERYRELSEKAADRSDAAQKVSNDISSAIPMGQPILVGHHSEKRHRRDIEKIHRAMDKAITEDKKAKYYAEKAATIESNKAIFTADPEAVTKLKEKLDQHEKLQTRMREANKAIRKNDDEALKALGFNEKQIIELKKPDFCGRIGFAAYQLSNNNAEISRLKKRIAHVSITQSREEKDAVIGDIIVRENAEFQGTEIVFPGKPNQHVIDRLKATGWRWSGYSKCWFKKRRDDHTLAFAKEIALYAEEISKP